MNAVDKSWVDVGGVNDIPKRGARVIKAVRGDIALFRTHEGDVFALDDNCPHKRGPLSQGIVHGRSVTCPLHNWVISLETGLVEAPDSGCSRTIAIRIENGRVFLSAHDLTAS